MGGCDFTSQMRRKGRAIQGNGFTAAAHPYATPASEMRLRVRETAVSIIGVTQSQSVSPEVKMMRRSWFTRNGGKRAAETASGPSPQDDQGEEFEREDHPAQIADPSGESRHEHQKMERWISDHAGERCSVHGLREQRAGDTQTLDLLDHRRALQRVGVPSAKHLCRGDVGERHGVGPGAGIINGDFHGEPGHHARQRGDENPGPCPTMVLSPQGARGEGCR